MYLVTKKTGEVITVSGKYGAGEPSMEMAIGFASNQSGVSAEDLVYCHIDDYTETAERIFNGWSYDVSINEAGAISFDFSKELAKPKLFFEMDTADAIDDGIDCITVSCIAKKEDGSIDTSVTGQVKIPIRLQTGNIADKAFSFVDGVGVSVFRSVIAGEFIVPRYLDRFGVYRVGNSVRPNIVMG